MALKFFFMNDSDNREVFESKTSLIMADIYLISISKPEKDSTLILYAGASEQTQAARITSLN
jgi:hypothetical protein